MPSNEDSVVVKTTVPEYQKQEWTKHAYGLDMSQSEFVRTMVQAGRSGIELDQPQPPSPDANPRGNGLKDRVLVVLRNHDAITFPEIVDLVTAGIERDVDAILQSLEDEGRADSNNVDGYWLVEDSNGDD